MNEKQLTFGSYGHTLNASQVFTADGQWVVYDTRNDDTHIGRTGSLEKVNVATGEVKELYKVENQTAHGPGVGAVACHPLEDKMIFIHGLLNCSAARPYGFTRRFGAILTPDSPSVIKHAEARVIKAPFVPGALRGGTHAHTWSDDGEWISFTYNDYLMEVHDNRTDLRTIGVMAPVHSVHVPEETAEEFSGSYFAVVAATVTEDPKPGTDEIDRAFDECWIGKNGYWRKDGIQQLRAIAFQGNIRNADGSVVTEVFVADVPSDITNAPDGRPLAGTMDTRPSVPLGLVQRRITYTSNRKHPGIQGPRFRLRTSPEGDLIYFLMKDDAGIVQVYAVPTTGGDISQITTFERSVQAQFNVHPGGKLLSCISDNSLWLTDLTSGASKRITARTVDEHAPIGGALWDPRGKVLVFNRYAGAGNDRYLQIFKLEME